MKLSSFKTGLVEGIKNLFNDLNIPVNPITELKAEPKDILSTANLESESLKLIEAVYPYGLVNDEAFNDQKTIKISDISEKYEAIAVFGVKLGKRENGLLPTRKIFADITRAFNREFKYTPVIIVFKYQDFITIASSERSEYIQKWKEGEKIGKITLLRDINIENTHTGHLKILEGLKIPTSGKNTVNSFASLHKHWQEVFDVSILNKKFYKELSNWYFWAMDNVEFPDDGEKRKDVRNATNLIRLITRIIFIWFIKEKNLVPEKLFNKNEVNDIIDDFNKNKKSGNYYRAILQNLFFGTLNQKMGERKFAKDGGHEDKETNREEYGVKTLWRYGSLFKISKLEAEKLFKDIPFLNGGLFDCLDKENEKNRTIYVDGFSRNPGKQAFVPDYLFFGEETEVDLNEIYGTKNKTYSAEGLINILNSYKFTIAENTPTEEDVALDPELLGKVFENLLASYNPETKTTARKQTGSFYTPREIVNYMVDESLIAYLKTKLDDETEETDHLLHRLFKHNDDQPFEDKDKVLKIVRAFDEIKILDPAVGSGAFPMGVLNKVVHVLSKLNPDNSEWQELQLKKIDKKMAETTDKPELKELDKLRDDIIKAFTDNEADYPRKLYLIENCIYGVDIQPIAIQICKLRFFISLIVDQKVDRRKDNHGIRPLPNLETKFVSANTLIGLDKPNQGGIEEIFIEPLKKLLLKVRHEHFSAKTRNEKLACIKKDKEIRKQIADVLIQNHYKATDANKIADFDLYDQNKSSDWFDPEWMFGIKEGFDVVIGNPPYILLQNIQGISNQTIDKYKKFVSAQYKTDLYHLFIEKGILLLSKRGSISFITPNTFIKNKYNNKLREFICVNSSILSIVLFYSQVFENVSVDNLIFVFSKNKKGSLSRIYEIKKSINDISVPIRFFDSKKIIKPEYIFNFDLDEKKERFLKKIHLDTKPLSFYGRSYFGIQTHDRETYVSEMKIDNNWMPVIDGGNVFRYNLKKNTEFVCYIKDAIKSGGNDEVYKKNRIVIRQVGKFPEGTICSPGIFTLNTIYNIFLNDNCEIDLKFLLALINSKVLRCYWILTNYDNKETFPKIKKDSIESIPIKKTNINEQKRFTKIVDIIMNKKKLGQDTTDLEKQIDAMVYELYGLTEEEIRIVEGGDKQ
ncbi:Eco57I restriction-modification methylase domain-containing protein [bacterium]|nr:Eco57I restriction-modification methylase domain-containing protein [bacterium]